MATLAAYSSGYEPISIKLPLRFAGLPVVAGFAAVTVAAAVWIGLSLTAVGTVSETSMFLAVRMGAPRMTV